MFITALLNMQFTYPLIFTVSTFTDDDLGCICVIDQAKGQDGWTLTKFYFCIFMDQDEVEVHKNAQEKNKASIQPS